MSFYTATIDKHFNNNVIWTILTFLESYILWKCVNVPF